MLDKKEITAVVIISIILAFTISLIKTTQIFSYVLLAVFLTIMLNIIGKKIASFYLDSEIKIKMWEISRWGYKPSYYFKKALAVGAILPIVLKFLTLGHFNWLACLTFEVKPKSYRAAKRYGTYAFSEMTEAHIGRIASWGIVTNLIFAIIGYLTGFPEFARLNIYYAAFNMIPLSNLDGNKIFFGNLVWWSFLGAIVLIALGYAFFLV